MMCYFYGHFDLGEQLAGSSRSGHRVHAEWELRRSANEEALARQVALERLQRDRDAADARRGSEGAARRHTRLVEALARIGGVATGEEIVTKRRVSEIARRLEVSRHTIDNWLAGECEPNGESEPNTPSVKNLARIAELSGFAGDYLLGAKDCTRERNAAALEQMQAAIAGACDYLMPGLHARVREELSVNGEALLELFQRVITDYADRRHGEESERDRHDRADRDDRSRFLEMLDGDGRKTKRYSKPVREATVAAISRARLRVQAGSERLAAIMADYLNDRNEHGAIAAEESRTHRRLERLARSISPQTPPPALRRGRGEKQPST